MQSYAERSISHSETPVLTATEANASPAHKLSRQGRLADNQLWQTDFTYLKIIGWGWFYLSKILDDCSRYIIAWKLCRTMRAEDITYVATGACRVRLR